MREGKWGLALAGLGLLAAFAGIDGAFMLVVIGCVLALPV
jgi:hypothetical protein